ncbi:hypothetical protein ONE63_009867 [Megalurothrips usitatus]|uniref:WD repeat-containing protein WRAP73-like n=1 Tax=Megalurothrips usitatus TaxID=439358 RepID=A0AAV7XK52_9NEOP|nr:hypothetical protein ONE63_009867 [Megalurothrips usitatus]
MASHPLPTLKKRKYSVWRALDKHVNFEYVSVIKFSPCTSLVALVTHQKHMRVMLLNYRVMSCNVLFEYVSDFPIEDMKWSSNSEALLIYSLKSHQFVVVQNVIDFDDQSLFRGQDPQLVRLVSIEWAPDNKHLVSVSDHSIYAFVHSLCNGRRILLPSIKSRNSEPLMKFNHDGRYLAFIHCTSSTNHVILMSTFSWSVVWKKRSEYRIIEGLGWSPDSSMLTVWDNSKRTSFMEVNGDVIQTIHYQNPLASGFVTTMFSATCDLFLAACVQDQVVLILIYNILNWSLIAVLDHGRDCCEHLRNSFVSSQASFSSCGNFIASSFMKGSVFIWNIGEGFKPSTVINTQNNSAGLQWHPSKTELAILTDDGTVFIWKHPQSGPANKTPSIHTVMINLVSAAEITWSKKNLIFRKIGPVQDAVVLVKRGRKRK